MARLVVPPKKPKNVILLKCYRCGTLYSPECKQKSMLKSENYESCPECGYDHNSDGQQIPLWLYNWLRWWRGTAKEDQDNEEE